MSYDSWKLATPPEYEEQEEETDMDDITIDREDAATVLAALIHALGGAPRGQTQQDRDDIGRIARHIAKQVENEERDREDAEDARYFKPGETW